MKRKIFKSKSNYNRQALNKSQHYIESQDLPSKKVSFKYPLVTEIINYVKETDEEDDEVVVPAKPIGWRTKFLDSLKDIFTRTNPNDGYSSVHHGYSANHDEVNSCSNTVDLDVSDPVNLTGAESTKLTN